MFSVINFFTSKTDKESQARKFHRRCFELAFIHKSQNRSLLLNVKVSFWIVISFEDKKIEECTRDLQENVSWKKLEGTLKEINLHVNYVHELYILKINLDNFLVLLFLLFPGKCVLKQLSWNTYNWTKTMYCTDHKASRQCAAGRTEKRWQAKGSQSTSKGVIQLKVLNIYWSILYVRELKVYWSIIIKI